MLCMLCDHCFTGHILRIETLLPSILMRIYGFSVDGLSECRASKDVKLTNGRRLDDCPMDINVLEARLEAFIREHYIEMQRAWQRTR